MTSSPILNNAELYIYNELNRINPNDALDYLISTNLRKKNLVTIITKNLPYPNLLRKNTSFPNLLLEERKIKRTVSTVSLN